VSTMKKASTKLAQYRIEHKKEHKPIPIELTEKEIRDAEDHKQFLNETELMRSQLNNRLKIAKKKQL
jgi:hypothetical protein